MIKGFDLAIEDGELCVLVGPSGCGKSTLLRMIAGLDDISGGEIAIDGRVVNGLPPARRGVSMVFQSYALYPHMTVYRNMAFGLARAKSDHRTVDQRVREAARILQIETLLDRKPRALSGGQQQRVAIGRAIVRDPDVFLFDEPLSNLDATLRVQMRHELARLHRQLGTTMIHVTHDQAEAMTLADRIVVLNEGRVEQIGVPQDVYDRPANLFVAEFIGLPPINLLPAHVSNGVVIFDGTATDAGLNLDTSGLPDGTLLTVGIRPEHWRETGETAGGNALAFEVDVVEDLGDMRLLSGILAAGPVVRLFERAEGPARLPGERLAIKPAAGTTHLFDMQGMRIATT